MKRQGWLVGGLLLSMASSGACGGADSDEQAHELDGDAGAQNFADDIKQLRDRLNELNPRLTMLGTRLDALEAPKVPGLCSAGELCIPDGIDLVRRGFQPIIAALCAKATTCCEARELNWLYGAAIKTAADCEATFTDLINNGQSDNYVGVFGGHLEDIVRAAHALNDTAVLVSVNADAVTACADEIAGEVCYRDREYSDRCTPQGLEAEEPCALSSLLTGKEREGDTCELDGYFNECGPGLVCRPGNYTGPGSSQAGLCSSKAAVGERCLRASDCDDLYCDFSTGTCKTRAKEGETCAYLDPTLINVGPGGGGGDGDGDGNGSSGYDSATLIDCERGLRCNPNTLKCVKEYCSEGSFCVYNSQCPSEYTCSNVGSEVLQNYELRHGFLGVCLPAVRDGQACAWHLGENDCASGRCADHDDNGSETCQPTRTECDYGCVGSECRTCAAGFFCENDGTDRCEPQIADGLACGSVGHLSCASGFCNNGTCSAKVASGGSCASGYTEQCPSGEFCSDGTCTDAADLGESCNARGCAAGLTCRSADAAGSDYTCFKYDYYTDEARGVADGASCSYDRECASGWCRSGSWTCSALLPEGSACDDELDYAHCIAGFGCVPSATSQTGYSCQKLKLPGEGCDPSLDDCRGGYCALHNDGFLCSPYGDYEPFCVEIGG